MLQRFTLLSSIIVHLDAKSVKLVVKKLKGCDYNEDFFLRNFVTKYYRLTNEHIISPASVSLTDTTSERVKEITFNDEYPEQFALTTDYHVLFLTWVSLRKTRNYF